MNFKKSILFLLFSLIFQNTTCSNSNFFSLPSTIKVIDKICHDYPGIDTQLHSFFQDILVRKLLLAPVALYVIYYFWASRQEVAPQGGENVVSFKVTGAKNSDDLGKIRNGLLKLFNIPWDSYIQTPEDQFLNFSNPKQLQSTSKEFNKGIEENSFLRGKVQFCTFERI